MNTEQIIMCVVALILGMLLANMLKSVCGCKVVEGQRCHWGNHSADFGANLGPYGIEGKMSQNLCNSMGGQVVGLGAGS